MFNCNSLMPPLPPPPFVARCASVSCALLPLCPEHCHAAARSSLQPAADNALPVSISEMSLAVGMLRTLCHPVKFEVRNGRCNTATDLETDSRTSAGTIVLEFNCVSLNDTLHAREEAGAGTHFAGRSEISRYPPQAAAKKKKSNQTPGSGRSDAPHRIP